MSLIIQVIDGAENCTFSLYSISDEDFALLFPEQGQDVEFSEDVFQRLGDQVAGQLWERLWMNSVPKPMAAGIHGTLFCGLPERRRFYPTKREAEMITGL